MTGVFFKMTDSVYCVLGRYNKLDEIKNAFLRLDINVIVKGVELIKPFVNVFFPDQLEKIKKDLIQSNFWNKEGRIIAHSYGAYLVAHALSELPPFPGSILFFSPVLGEAIDRKNAFLSCPPRSHKLRELAEANEYPIPSKMAILTGADDEGCDPKLATEWGKMINANVRIIVGAGHNLPDSCYMNAIKEFMCSVSDPG